MWIYKMRHDVHVWQWNCKRRVKLYMYTKSNRILAHLILFLYSTDHRLQGIRSNLSIICSAGVQQFVQYCIRAVWSESSQVTKCESKYPQCFQEDSEDSDIVSNAAPGPYVVILKDNIYVIFNHYENMPILPPKHEFFKIKKNLIFFIFLLKT